MGHRIRAIDLFCGAGGLTSGLISSGIEVVAGIDADPNCKYPFEVNHKNATYICRDVCEISGSDLEPYWDGAEFRLLAGCAPCQPFSTFSQGKDHSEDSRWRLLDQFSRLVAETSPELVTMENVPSLLKTEVFHQFVSRLKQLNYNIEAKIVNCANFGVPQKRLRLVLIAVTNELELPDIENFTTQPVSVKSAICGLERLKAGGRSVSDSLHRVASLSALNIKRIKKSKPGGTWRDWPEKLRSPCHTTSRGNGYVAVYGRMEWENPAPTITTQCYNYGSGRFGHPEQHRAISLREASLLQGFPNNFHFEDPDKPIPTRDIARLIGNAVPPPLGAAIGKTLIKSLT